MKNMMNAVEIIEKKRDKKELTKEEIAFFIDGYVKGEIPDYQASALLMAIVLNGMTEKETSDLTEIMAKSGEREDFSAFGVTIDKHSTGGVGDSTTFVVLPVLAALGYSCPKMSGKGLGFTGGTLDKLASVGARTDLSAEEIRRIVEKVGLAVSGQTKDICPADKKLYALRDVTGTVMSIPLIASSIMSKKLAGGASVIVLDVKCGSGAFMRSQEKASELAKAMVKIGRDNDRKVCAVVTDMNEPLDDYIGNAFEIFGALKVLDGERNKLREVAKALVVAALFECGEKNGETLFDEAIKTGAAKRKFVEMMVEQGADKSYFDDPAKLISSRHVVDVTSKTEGYISAIDTAGVGYALSSLGAGRMKLDDVPDLQAGIINYARIGKKVGVGDKLFTLYFNREIGFEVAKTMSDLVTVTDEKTEKPKTVYEIYYGD